MRRWTWRRVQWSDAVVDAMVDAMVAAVVDTMVVAVGVAAEGGGMEGGTKGGSGETMKAAKQKLEWIRNPKVPKAEKVEYFRQEKRKRKDESRNSQRTFADVKATISQEQVHSTETFVQMGFVDYET